MSKRKVALFMAAILTVTSVYPGGAVFAEEAVATEPAIEVAAEEIPADADIADPAEEQAAAPEEELTDGAEAELVDDETMPPAKDEDAAPEDAAKDQTADSEPALSDTIKADEELEIDLSDAAQAVPVAADAGQDDGEKKISSVSLTAASSYDAGIFDQMLRRNPPEIQAEIAYDGGKTEPVKSWDIHSCYADDNYVNHNAGVYVTENGDIIYLTLWSGTTVIDLPGWFADDSLISKYKIPTGTYTLKVTVDGMPEVTAEQDLTIKGPENAVELKEREKAEYSLEENECKWYKFTAEEAGSYLTPNVPEAGELYTYADVYTLEGNDLVKKETYDGVLEAGKGDEFYVAVYQPEGAAAKGSISVRKKRTIASVAIDTDRSFDVKNMSQTLLSLPIEITYEDGVKEPFESKYDYTSTYFPDGQAEGYQAVYYETENGDKLYLTLWLGSDNVDILYSYDVGIQEGPFTLKLFTENKLEPLATAEIKVEAPESFTELEPDTETVYHVGAGERVWYKFTAEEAGKYSVVNIDNGDEVEQGRCYPEVYILKDGYWQKKIWGMDGFYEAEAGEEFFIALEEYTGEPCSGTIEVKRKKEITAVALDGVSSLLEAATANDALMGITAEISYNNGDPADSVPSVYWYTNNSYESKRAWSYGLSLDNSYETIYLTLWSGGQIVDMPAYGASEIVYTGDLSLKVFLQDNPEPLGEKAITVKEPVVKADLAAGVSQAYELAQDEYAWYSFTNESGEPADYTLKLYGDNGISGIKLYTYTDGVLRMDGNFLYSSNYSFTAKPGEEYMFLLHAYDDDPDTGKIRVEQKRVVASAKLEAKDTYDPLTIVESLRRIQAVITYEQGEPKTQTSVWSYGQNQWFDDNGYLHYDPMSLQWNTENGDVVFLTLWSEEDIQVPIPQFDSENQLTEGAYTLKLMVNGKVMDSHRITLEHSKADPLPDSYMLPGGEEKHFSIAAEEKGAILEIFEDSVAASVLYSLYEESDDGTNTYVQNDIDSPTDGKRLRLDKGKNYRLVVQNTAYYPVKLTFTRIDRPDVKSVTGFALEGEYSGLEAVDALWASMKGLTVEYADAPAKTLKSLSRTSYDCENLEGSQVKRKCIQGTTENADIVQLRLQKQKEAEYKNMNVPKRNGKLAAGEYKALIYANGELKAEQSFTVSEDKLDAVPELPAKFDLGSKEAAYYTMTISGVMNLALNFEPQSGETVRGKKFRVFLYKKNEAGEIQKVDSYKYKSGSNILTIKEDEEAEQQYWIKIRNASKYDVSVDASLKKRLVVESVKLMAKPSYDAFTAREEIKNIEAVVHYAGGEPSETISSWEEKWLWDEETGSYYWGLISTTQNGDTAHLTLRSSRGAEDLWTSYSNADIVVGACTLELELIDMEGSVEDAAPVSLDPPKSPETLPDSVALAGEETRYYFIEPTADTNVEVQISSEGSSIEGEAVSFMIYRSEPEKLSYYTGGSIWLGDDPIYSLEAGRYWIAIKNKKVSSLNVGIRCEEKREFSSVTGLAFAKEYSQLDVVGKLYGTALTVQYAGGSSEPASNWGCIENEEEFYCLQTETKNGNELQLWLEDSDGYVDIPSYSIDETGEAGILAPGNYTITLYVDGVKYGESASFAVKAADLSSLDQLILNPSEAQAVSLAAGECKWFSFTPQTAGKYTLYASYEGQYADSYVELYDKDLQLITYNDDGAEEGNFTITYSLNAGEKYYYKVYGYHYRSADFAVTLTTPVNVTGAKAGKQQSQSVFTKGETIRLDMSMTFTYSDGKTAEIFVDGKDKFGNSVRAQLYSKDGTKYINIDDAKDKPGDYKVVVKAYYYDSVSQEYIPYKGENFQEMTAEIKVAQTECEHVFSWVVTKQASCTTSGVEAYKCEKCGFEQTTRAIGAVGHKWTAGQIVAAATVTTAAQRQYECSVCHTKETRPEGNPLPASITVPATKANMKTGQSTSVFNVGMTAGDSIVSVTSSNTKLMKVSSINKTKGTFKLKAGKKTGKVKITIKLASGQSKVITLTVQKKKVTTKKVKVTKKLTLKKGAKYTLKPVITPITTQDKVKFKSSNKKIATVTNKGAIKAKKPGKVTITVTCGKKKASCKITVTN